MEKQKGLAPLLIVIIIALAVGGYLIYQRQPKPNPTPNPLPQQTTQPSPSPIDKTANWKTYNRGDLSLKYPPGWSVRDSDYLNSVFLENKSGSVKITISEGQYPYGFAGPMETKENPLKVVVGDKEYQTKEIIIDNKKAYVNFEVDTPQKHHILFGTGYPADNDLNYSLEDYNASKDTILKILSTLKFQ